MGAATCAVPEGTVIPERTLDDAALAVATLTVSERAATHIKNFITKRGKGLGIRLGVRTSGCTGMAYTLEFADAAVDGDLSFENLGVTVFVDPKSMAFLDGTQLDFVREGLNEGFKFNNPNVKNECGCGESFNV
ncbi:MAG: iron-sulfur cluster assembly protein IscA [Betaproteobacteria bacterium]|jgi:iron-sulfur cluster assembly protein|nr:MAG: iron-sulfur cluster assembly protein IscA [Betaproteobacteria bacterium]